MIRSEHSSSLVSVPAPQHLASTDSPIHKIRDYISLTKPRITIMVLFTAAVGMWLADGVVTLQASLFTFIATTGVVGAANVFNCWLERDIDKKMDRTADRPLPSGRMDARGALIFGCVLAVVSVPVLYFGVNPATGCLGALAFFSYAAIYTPLKGVTPLALYVGAIPGAIPPLLGWASVTGTLEAGGLVLFGIMFIWQVPHFLAISLFREPDYARAGLRVAPVVWGAPAAKWQAVLSIPPLIITSLLLYPLGIVGLPYLVVASLLGVGFLVPAVVLLFHKETFKWARYLFFTSLIYLTGLFGILLCDARLP